jgi:hypothetical protein
LRFSGHRYLKGTKYSDKHADKQANTGMVVKHHGKLPNGDQNDDQKDAQN